MPIHEILKLIQDSNNSNRNMCGILFTTFTRSMRNSSQMQRIKEYGVCMHVLTELADALATD